MRPVADTSFLVAAIDPSDSHHAEASRRIEEEGAPAVHREALAELLHVIQFQYRKRDGETAGLKASRRALAVLVEEVGCAMELEELDFPGTRSLFSTHSRLSWVDAAVIMQARERPLWTFDEEQQSIHARMTRGA